MTEEVLHRFSRHGSRVEGSGAVLLEMQIQSDKSEWQREAIRSRIPLYTYAGLHDAST